jgi:hypothetical protein
VALLAALVAAIPVLSTAEASVSRRIKLRAAQDARRDTGPQIAPGQLHIMISIRSQRVAVYSDGVLATRSGVSTGVPGHPTPTGVFSIIQKNRHHRSNIYSGAPMPFMQRITWSGIALHQGVLPGRPASHGCIRLSGDFASTLWKRTKLGARVIVTRDEAVPYPFSHPRLFVARPAESASIETAPAIAPVQTAQAETTASDAARLGASEVLVPDYPPVADITADIRKTLADENPGAKKRATPGGPVSVFISRKERKLFVRQGFLPVFETLVQIRDDDKPFGTHVFTAAEVSGKGLKWLAVSLPVDAPKPKAVRKTAKGKSARKDAPEPKATLIAEQPVPDAAEVLDRIEIPRDAINRIEALMGPGASLIVADSGLGYETGEGTDFIVLTR